MGFRLHIDDRAGSADVSLALVLTRQETSELFLSGDSMVSWPTDGLCDSGDPLLARTSMFVSEIAAKPRGLMLHYATRAQAERSVVLLGRQLQQLGIVTEE
jgi:hypothetical protein